MKKILLLLSVSITFLASAQTILLDDFEEKGNGLTWTVISGSDIWEIGKPSQKALTSSFDGRKVLSTSLDNVVRYDIGSYFTTYSTGTVYTIESSSFILPDNGEDLFLEYVEYCTDCSSKERHVSIIVNDTVKSLSSTSSSSFSEYWLLKSHNVTNYAGKEVKLRFTIANRTISDFYQKSGLWSIDHLMLRDESTISTVPNSYYGLNTSYGIAPNETFELLVKPTSTSGAVSVKGTSSNQSIVRDSNITIAQQTYLHELQIVPNENASGNVLITLEINNGTTTVYKDFDLFVSEPLEIIHLDFESESDIKWRESPISSGVWQIGEVSSGPITGYNSPNAMATFLNKKYPAKENTVEFVSSKLTLPADGTVLLDMICWMDITNSFSGYDKAEILIVDENNENYLLEEFTNNQSNSIGARWQNLCYDISQFGGQKIAVKFRFAALANFEDNGWFIDNLNLKVYNHTPVTNSAPTISSLDDLILFSNERVDLIVDLFDLEQKDLTLTVESSNESFIAVNDITITDKGFVKGLTFYPEKNGITEITLTVSDGILSTSSSFKVIKQLPNANLDSIVVRSIYKKFKGYVPDTTFKNWEGVQVSSTGRVTGLALSADQAVLFPKEITKLSELISLNFQSSKLIGSIPEEISSLSKLNYLNLGNNILTGALPVGLFDIQSLDTLILSNNQFSGPISSNIGQLQELKYLDLNSVPFGTSLPVEIGQLSNLEFFRCAYSVITGELPDEFFANLNKLKYLDMKYNRGLVGKLPSSVENLTSLLEFDMEHTGISQLPEEIGGMTALTYLNIGNVDITELPDGIGNLSSLRELDVSNTFPYSFKSVIKTIPSSIGNLSNLRTLNVSNIGLESIPSQMGNLENLTTLNLSNNSMISLPSQIGNLSKLTTLNLTRNKLSAIPDLSNLPSNLNLNVSYNLLDFADVEAIQDISFRTFSYVSQEKFGNEKAELGEEGEDVILSQGLIEGSENTYQWYKDGTPLAGKTSMTLSLRSTSLSDAGTYYLEVKSTLITSLTLRSNDIVLNINEAGNTMLQINDTILYINENSPLYTVLMTFPSIDTDGDALTYSMVSSTVSSGYLQLSNNALRVYYSSPNFELYPQYQAVILQKDNRGLNDEINITVNINDLPENEVSTIRLDPTFSTTIDLPENSPSETILISNFPIIKSDTTSTLTYSIQSGNINNAFKINPTTGELSVDNEDIIDFEQYSCFSLQVRVNCSCNSSLYITLTIEIIDDLLEDLSVPPFLLNQNFLISKYIENDRPIGHLVATDKDLDPITYTIISGNELGIFNLEASTGLLTIDDNSSLDFTLNEQYNLLVEVKDPFGRTNTGNVSIEELIIVGNESDLNEENQAVNIYPNPVFDQLSIEVYNNKVSSLVITDLNGVVLLESSNVQSEKIDLPEISSGIYFIKMIIENEVHTRKFVKK